MTYDTALGDPILFEQSAKRCFFILWCVLAPFAVLRFALPYGGNGGHGALLLWVALAYSWWLVLTLAPLCWALGAAALRRWRLLGDRPEDSTFHLFAFGTGVYLFYTALLLVASLGQLNLVGIGVCVACIVVFIWTAPRRPSAPKVEHRRRALTRKQLAAGAGLGVAALVWFVPYVAQTLLPNTDWDGAMYHLPLAKRFLTVGIWATDPDFEQYNFAGAIHLFYALFMALGADRAIASFNLLFGMFVVVTTYVLAREFWGGKVAVLAAAVCACTNVLWEMTVTPRIDVHLALFTVLACYAFLLWEREPQVSGLLVVMGMMIGMTMGIKFTAIFSLVVLGFCVVVVWVRNWRAVSGRNRYVAIALCCAAFPSVLWYARDAWSLGDPVYPLSRGTVYRTDDGHIAKLDPAVEKLSSRMPASPESEAQFNRPPTIPVPSTLFNWWNMLRRPGLYARGPYNWLSPFLLAFFVAPLFQRGRTLWWLYGIAICIYLVVGIQTYLVRYALPVLPLFAVGAGVTLARFNRRWLVIGVAAALTLNLGINSVAEAAKVKKWRPMHWLRNAEEKDDWLCHTGYNGATAVPVLVNYVNDQVRARRGPTPDDTILMVGAATGYVLECHSLPDGSRIAQRFLAELVRADGDYAKVAASLSKQRIRYLLVDEGYFKWVTIFIPLDKREALPFAMHHLAQFTDAYAELVWNGAPSLKLYRLKEPSR